MKVQREVDKLYQALEKAEEEIRNFREACPHEKYEVGFMGEFMEFSTGETCIMEGQCIRGRTIQ